jgi:hypothetical protein
VLPAHGAYPVNKETTSGDGRKQTANGQSSSSQASVVKLKTQRAPSDSKPTVASTVSNSNETNLQAGESSTNRESDQQKGKKGRPSAAGRVRSGMCAII